MRRQSSVLPSPSIDVVLKPMTSKKNLYGMEHENFHSSSLFMDIAVIVFFITNSIFCYVFENFACGRG